MQSNDHIAANLCQYAWDFGLPVNTPVLAAKGGIAHPYYGTTPGSSCWNGACSSSCANAVYAVWIDHGDGTAATYLHLWGINVTNGQQVTTGQQIGVSGNSGYSCGPHLHFQVMNTCGSWWCNSIPSSFEGGTVPTCDQTITSHNTGGAGGDAPVWPGPIDVDGDGRADWIQVQNSANQGWVGLSNGDGTFGQVFTGAPAWTWQSSSLGAAKSYTHYFADVDGNGKTDWIQVVNNMNQGYVGLSNGNGSFGALPSNGGLVTTSGASWTWQSSSLGAVNSYTHYFADVDGDGKADWIQVENNTNQGYIGLSNGNGSFGALPSNGGLVTTTGASWTWQSNSIGAANNYTHYFADVDGDGKADWIQVENNTNQGYVGLSNGNGSFGALPSNGGLVTTTGASWTWQSNSIGAANSYTHYFADVNGDGKADWIQVDNNTNQGYVGLSNGNGSFGALPSNGGLVTTTGSSWTWQSASLGATNGYTHFFADVNGDDKADWIQVQNNLNQGWVGLSNGNGSFGALPSNGGLVTTTGSSWTWQSNYIGAATGYHHYFADVDGDGKADWIQVQDSANSGWVGLSNGNGSFATLPSNGGLVTTAGVAPYWTKLTPNVGAASSYTHYLSPAKTCIPAAGGVPSSPTSRSDGILKPLNGSCTTNPTLLWAASCKSASYNVQLQWWNGASWQPYPQVNGIAPTSYALKTAQAPTWWIWAVQSCSGSGCSAFSSWDEIYVGSTCNPSPPPAPPLPSPPMPSTDLASSTPTDLGSQSPLDLASSLPSDGGVVQTSDLAGRGTPVNGGCSLGGSPTVPSVLWIGLLVAFVALRRKRLC